MSRRGDTFETDHRLLTISRDGAWLLFESTTGSWPRRVFVLYDIEGNRRYPVVADDEAATRLRNVQLDGEMAFFDESLRAFVLPTLARNAFFAVTPPELGGEALLELVEEPAPKAPAALNPATDRLVEVRKPSSREAVLWVEGAGGPHPVAQHQLSGALESNIEISDLRVSWDHRYLAYLVSGTRGGSFSVAPQGYVVPLDGSRPPLLIGSPVYPPLCWHPQGGRLFAYAVDSEGRRAIFSWQLKDLL